MKVPPGNTDPEMISREQLAARWVISVQSIKRWEADGVLTPVRLGPRLIRYRFTQIRQIEEDGRM